MEELSQEGLIDGILRHRTMVSWDYAAINVRIIASKRILKYLETYSQWICGMTAGINR